MIPYRYFINIDADSGYWWALVRSSEDSVCRSDVYEKNSDCMSSLRAAQRHAATAEVVDESN